MVAASNEAGMAGNARLIFTSDKGAHWTPEDRALYAHLANGHWRGQKADIWDAGHRIPFLARWPGHIRADGVSNELGCLTDLVSTAAALTGAKLPDNTGEDSYNLLPALLGTNTRPISAARMHTS